MKERLALALWLLMRSAWSGPRYGPCALPNLFGEGILFLQIDDKRALDSHSLQERFFSWLTDRGGTVTRVTSVDEIAAATSPRFLAVSYEWFAQASRGYFVRVLQVRRIARQRSLKIVTCAPDTILWNLNLGYGLLAASTGGVVALTQNTADEAHRYGIPNAVSPVFFTWPRSHQELWTPESGWVNRGPLAVLAGTGGLSRRRALEPLEDEFVHSGWTVSWSRGNQSYEDYVRLMASARAIVTTSLVQEEFRWRVLRSWEPRTTVTGRVWEGFKVGAIVVTHECRVLDELGFRIGTHYISLDEFSDAPECLFGLSSADQAAIAKNGQDAFLKVLASEEEVFRDIGA